MRSAHAVFSRAVAVGPPVEFVLDVVAEGRSTATAVVAVHQNGRRCLSITVLADAIAGINVEPGDADRALAEMTAAGATIAR